MSDLTPRDVGMLSAQEVEEKYISRVDYDNWRNQMLIIETNQNASIGNLNKSVRHLMFALSAMVIGWVALLFFLVSTWR